MDDFRAKQQSIPSLSWRRDDRFSAQSGKDDPNPRTARARQRRTIKKKDKRNKDKKVDAYIDRSIDNLGRLNRPRPYIGTLDLAYKTGTLELKPTKI
jgi:hypothetical protein